MGTLWMVSLARIVRPCREKSKSWAFVVSLAGTAEIVSV